MPTFGITENPLVARHQDRPGNSSGRDDHAIGGILMESVREGITLYGDSRRQRLDRRSRAGQCLLNP